MFDKHNKTPSVNLNSLIQQHLSTLDTPDGERNLQALNGIIRSILKGAIGKPHEYTFEESLFILKEEEVIDQQVYDRLKKILMQLVFLNYSNYEGLVLQRYVNHLREHFAGILPLILAKVNKEECAKLYQEEMQPSEDKKEVDHKLESKRHKQDIIETQQQISQQFQERLSGGEQTVKVPYPVLYSKVTGYDIAQEIWYTSSQETQQVLEQRLSNLESDPTSFLGEHAPYMTLAKATLLVNLALVKDQTISQALAFAEQGGVPREAGIYCLSVMLMH